MRFFHRILPKFVAALILLVLMTLSVTGFLFYHAAKRGLDKELGDRLTSLARVGATMIEGDKLLVLMPGDEETRMYANMRRSLLKLKSATGVKRIYVFDREGRSLLDSEPFPIGQEYLELRPVRRRLEEVWRGNASSSFLYRGADGLWYKSGYAPVGDGGQLHGVLAVKESARFLSQVDRLRNGILRTVGVGVLVAIGIGVLLAKTIVNPLQKLVATAQTFGNGDLSSRAQLRVRDEVGFLGRTFDEMAEKVERRAKEKEEELKSLMRLAAGVAHEIRNPLGVIKVAASTLEESLDRDGKTGELLGLVRGEVERLDRVVANLLSFAHPKPPSVQKTEINQVLASDLSAIEPQLLSSNVILKRRFGADIPELRLDPGLFHQVVLNLATNAAQAMPRGGELAVSTSFNSSKGTVGISFKDTGEGIPATNLEKLFDPFFTTREKGTGLGLAIVHQIVKAHGGEIEVRSHEGKGSEFTISLPIDKTGEEI